MLLNSFADLAKAFEGKLPTTPAQKKEIAGRVKKVTETVSFVNIMAKLGKKAAMIWAFLNDQEACKRYGAKGEIQHDAKQLAIVFPDWDAQQIQSAVIALTLNGYARANERYVMAA